MMYESALINTMLDVLENRMSGIADSIPIIVDKGYVVNKNKITILDWTSILINAYENIDVFDKKQQEKLNTIYKKVLRL